MSEQYDLFGGMPPHEKVDTSIAAARAIEPKVGLLQKRVLAFIVRQGEWGATDEEIEEGLGLKHQTASARRRELVLLGYLECAGRRVNKTGRTARVHVGRRTEVH